LHTMQVVRTISIPKWPHTVLMSPDKQTAYVACMKSGNVAVINLSDWPIKGLIKVVNNADEIGWASFSSGQLR
jgi:DNA-binding beta-propeller fold protein YncE